MAYTYTGTPNQRIEQAKRRISTEGVDVNATLSAYQNRIAQIKQQEQTQMMPEAQYQPSGNVGERLGDTLGEFFKDVATGVEKAFEGLADFGAGAVGVVAGWAGNNELKQEMTDFVARDLVEEQWEAARRAGLDVDFDDSYINELSETGQSIVKGVAQGIGQMLPTIVVTAATAGAGTAATAAGTLTSAGAQALTKAGQIASLVGLGASAAGRGTEEALNTEIVDEDGNVTKPSLDRAYLYGLATGAVEMATEKLVGGAFSKVTGAGALDNLIAKLAKSAKFSKAVKFGLDAIGEGVEEMVASSVEKTLQTIYNSSDGKVHWESPDIQDVFVSGVVGTLTSSVMGGGQIAVRKASSVASTQDAILDIQNSIEKANNLSKNGKLAEQAESLEAEINKATTEISRRYQRASDKGKAKIMQIEGIQNYITEDGEVRSTALEEGAVEITREQAVGTMSGSLALTRRNEVANVLKAQKAQIANALDETQKANFTKLEKMLDLSGKTSGNQLKVVAVESMPSNAFIKDDIVYISKDRLSDANDTARDFAHEVFHFAEGTSEYRQVAKFFDGVSVSGKKLFDLALEEVSTLGYDVDSRIFELIKQGRSAQDIVKAGYDSSQVELALSEIRAKQSETLFGDADVINRLAESNQSLAKKILTRIKDCIKILDAVFKGEKDTLETIKTMRKAEKLWMDALAVAGQKRSMATGKDDAQKSNRSYYDEYATLAMQWAYSDKTKVGEQTIRFKNKKAVILEKTHDGYIEIAEIKSSLKYDEYWEQINEHNERNKNQGIHEDIKEFRFAEGHSDRDNGNDGGRLREGEQNGRLYRGQYGSDRDGTHKESTRDSRIKHSLRGDVDSQGHHLSKEQIEYFKDSKVVNENGNLLVVYHGTGETFTRFSRNMIYFSDNADVADSYARDGKEKMTGYLNITKPFVVDAKGAKWSRIPLSVNVKKFLDKFEINSFYEDGEHRATPADIAYAIMDAIESGADYDGVIIRNVDDTGRYWKNSPTNLGTDYIAFSSSQFKNLDNKTPTGSPDIRYSLRVGDEDVAVTKEQTKNLVALHNLSADKLLKVIELGGFPMPSIAITKAELPHDDFGDITIVFGKKTIDPQANSKNVVYDKDAWTPTMPKVDVKLNEDAVDSLIAELRRDVGEYKEYKSDAYSFFDSHFKNGKGEYVIAEYDYDKDSIGRKALSSVALVAAYLKDKGSKDIAPVYKKRSYTIGHTSYSYEDAKKLLEAVGITKDTDRTKLTDNELDEMGEKYVNYLARANYEKYKDVFPEENYDFVLEKFKNKKNSIYQVLFMAEEFFNDRLGNEVYDRLATQDKLQAAIKDISDFNDWIWSRIENTFDKKGIENDSDVYDRYGNRRSFEQRHFEYNLNNIVKAMSKGKQEGKSVFGVSAGSLAARLSNKFDSIESMHEAEWILRSVSEEQMVKFKDKTFEMFTELINDIAGTSKEVYTALSRMDDVGEILGSCASVKPLTIENIINKFNNEMEGYESVGYKFNEAIAEKALLLFEMLKTHPTAYFEAKPRRAVALSEIKSVLLPKNTPQKLIDKLNESGINHETYTSERSRTDIIQEMDGIRFSKRSSDVQKAKDRIIKMIDGWQIGAFGRHFIKIDNTKNFFAKGSLGEQLADQILVMANEGDPIKYAYATDLAEQIVNRAVASNIDPQLLDIYLEEATAIKEYMHKFNLSGIRDEIRYRYDKKGSSAIYLVWQAPKDVRGSDPAEIAKELNRYGCNFNLDQPDADIFFDIMDAYEKANDLLRNEVYEKASEYLSENEKESLIEYLRDNIVDYMTSHSGKDTFERYYADMMKQAEQYLATAKQKAKDIVKLATLEAQIEHEKAKHAFDQASKKLVAKLEQERREIEISAMQEAADAIEYNREYNNLISKVWSEADSLTLDKIKKYKNASDLLNNEFAGIIKKLAGIKWRGELKKHTTRKIIADFGKWYNTSNPLLTGGLDQTEIDRLMGDENVSSIGYLDKFVLQGIEIMKENQTRISKGGKTKGQPIPNNYDLTYDELLIARSVLASARHILKNYNTLQIAKQQVVLSETAIQTESLARKMSKVTHMKHKATDKALGAFMHTLTPSDVIAYMFGYQDNAMSDLFEQIQNGETHARAVEIDLKTIVEDFFKEHKKYKKTLSNAVKFGKYEVRKDIALSLYMHTLQKDSLEGLLLGGWGYRADDGYWKEQGKLTEADIKELKNALSETDKEFAKVLRKFFDKAGEAMVEADMQVKGYSLIDNENGNKNYYPIKRYSGDMAKTIADSEAIKNAMSVSVANFSFTKERVKNQRRIDVLPVMSVVNTHAKQVSLYNGLAMPIREFQRLYNVNIAQDGTTASVRNTLNESVWNGINKYLTTLLTDIQSEKGIKGENGAVSRVLGKVRSNYAKFQLGANPKTWFSQLSGYPAALPYLSVQSMAKAFTRSLHWKGANAQNLMNYCEWARVKANDGGVVLVETLSDKLGMVGDIATKPIQSMDNFLNRIIWNAAQFEVERTTGHKFGSKENMERAAKLHTEIGRKTQGNSATSELAAMQRHQSEIVKGLAMFNSDGFKMVSRLFEAINRVRVQNYLAKNHPDMVTANSQKQARVFLAKTTTAILTSALIYTLVGELFKFLYDKDRKDKDGNEIDFAEDFGMSYLSTIVGMLPIVRDIYSLVVEGYDVDHYALEGFVDLATSFEGIVEGVTILASGEPFETQDIAKPLKDLVNALGLLTGIPTRNVYNTIYGLIKRFDASAAYEMDSIFYSQGFTADLKKAVIADDVDLQKTIIGLMLKDSGFTDTSEKVNVKLRELNAEGYSVLPKTIQDTLHHGGTSYNLSSKQVKQFKSVYGQANAEVEDLVSDRHFTSLSAEVQAQAIKWIYDYYYECAVFNVIGEEADSKKQLFGETMDISKFALTIAACKAVESQLDKKGNVIAGSRKAQILKLLTKLNLTSAERAIILAYLGYSVGENEGILKAFIRKIGLTKQQQKLLLSYCGVA